MASLVTEALLRRHIRGDRVYWLADCRNQILGRLAMQIGAVLQGKHKAYRRRDVNCGDPVIVINAREIQLTGRKRETKVFRKHTGWRGGLKETPYAKMLDENPARILWRAVKHTLPRNKTRFRRLDMMRIFSGPEHPYASKQPIPLFNSSLGARLGFGEPPYEEEFDLLWDRVNPYVHPESLEEGKELVRSMRPSDTRQDSGLAFLLRPALDKTYPEWRHVKQYVSRFDSVSAHGKIGAPSDLT